MLIAIEGIDGSGKGTQAGRLVQTLNTNYHNPNGPPVASLLTFPAYHTFFGKKIKEYLQGLFGDIDELPPFMPAMLYALNRFETADQLRLALRSGKHVVCDRYVGSNTCHAAGKMFPDFSLAEQLQLVADIEHMEYQVLRLPRPDLTIYLDIPAKIGHTRAQARRQAARASHKAPAPDIHEDNVSYLEAVRAIYQHLAAAREDWVQVDGLTSDGQERSLEAIGVDVLRAAKDRATNL